MSKLYAEPPKDILKFVKERELVDLIYDYKKQLKKIGLEEWVISELLQLFVRNIGVSISYELAIRYISEG